MSVQEEVHQQGKGPEKLCVQIAYNGMNDSIDYEPQEAADAVRERALTHYGVHGPDRNQNFLFGPDNQTELQGGVAIGSQVQPGSQLYLRPRSAAGGA